MMTRLSEKKKGGGSVDDADKSDLLQTFDECVELDVDLRLTVNEIKERLLECCSSCLVDLGLQNNSSGNFLVMFVAFFLLMSFLDGLYLTYGA
jgi:hypothetical protein